MVIGIDLRCLPSDGSPGAGIAHAARALVNKFITFEDVGISWILYLPKGAVTSAEERIMREKSSKTRIVRLENAGGAALRRALATRACDLLFVPSGAIPPGVTIPCVPWVHDIAIFEHPEWFAETLLRRRITTTLFQRGIKSAVRILAVSDTTKRDLVERFAIDSGRIVVTYEGGDDLLASLEGEKLAEAKAIAKKRTAERGLTNRYILCMGTLEPRKNIPMLINAWAKARPLFQKSTDLVIAGRDGWKLGPITQAIEASGARAPQSGSRIRRIETPSDDDRRDLLLAAELLTVPSLFEGFGIVALEGMQAGTAVVASNAGALPEVMGSADMTLAPENSDAWTSAMVHFMNDEQARIDRAAQCKARSKELGWEKSAKIALDVLTKAVG